MLIRMGHCNFELQYLGLLRCMKIPRVLAPFSRFSPVAAGLSRFYANSFEPNPAPRRDETTASERKRATVPNSSSPTTPSGSSFVPRPKKCIRCSGVKSEPTSCDSFSRRLTPVSDGWMKISVYIPISRSWKGHCLRILAFNRASPSSRAFSIFFKSIPFNSFLINM